MFKNLQNLVLETFIHETHSLVHLSINDELISTTLDHPFYVAGKGFISAGELHTGDVVIGFDTKTYPVDNICFETLEIPVAVYNFQVADFHTYHVGYSGVLVHNTECSISRSKYPEAAKHMEDAIADGHPDVLTIDRAGAAGNRQASLSGIDKVPGLHLDEFPPAMFKEGGSGASVRPISPSQNTGSGASMGNQLRPYPDGTKVNIVITP